MNLQATATPRNSLPTVSPSTKWGGAISHGPNGYQIVPDTLIRNQQALGLDNTDMVLLLNICMHWWESEPEKLPHPRTKTLAKRIGTSVRTVERHIERMCKLGLMEWLPPQSRSDGPAIRPFKLDGLRLKLQTLAEDQTSFK